MADDTSKSVAELVMMGVGAEGTSELVGAALDERTAVALLRAHAASTEHTEARSGSDTEGGDLVGDHDLHAAEDGGA